MALTRINSRISGFIQPSVDSTVTIPIDPGINWLEIGLNVTIHGAGDYVITNRVGFQYTLKLLRAEIETGFQVPSSLIYPSKAGNEYTGVLGLNEVLATNNNAGGRTIKGLGKGTQTGDAVTFEQININENINPLAIYNTAAGN